MLDLVVREVTDSLLKVEVAIHYNYTGMLISPQPDQEGNKLGSMSGTPAISTTSGRELSPSFFFLRCKETMEIHAILTGILTCSLPDRAKELSALLYF